VAFTARLGNGVAVEGSYEFYGFLPGIGTRSNEDASARTLRAKGADQPPIPDFAICGKATTMAKRISRPTKPTTRKKTKFIRTAPAAKVVT